MWHNFRRMPGHGPSAFPTGHEGHPRQHQTRAPTRDTVVNVAKEQRRLWRAQKHKHGNRVSWRLQKDEGRRTKYNGRRRALYVHIMSANIRTHTHTTTSSTVSAKLRGIVNIVWACKQHLHAGRHHVLHTSWLMDGLLLRLLLLLLLQLLVLAPADDARFK